MLPLVLHSSASIPDTSQVLVVSGLSFGMQLYGYTKGGRSAWTAHVAHTKVNQLCAIMYTLLLSTSQAAQVSQAVCKMAVPGKLLQALRSMLRSSSTALPSSTLLDTRPLSLLQL